MTRDEAQAEINGLSNLLAQRDNDALEAIDALVAGVSECTSALKLPQLILDTLSSFRETAKTRIALREKLRELVSELEELEE